MYFMSYKFIFIFSVTFTEKYLFLKLLYRVINQKDFKHKKLRFSLRCNLEQELKPILYNIYQKNIHSEVMDHHLT